MKRKWKIISGALIAAIILSILAYEVFKPLKTDLLKVEERSISKSFTEDGQVVSENERYIYTAYAGKIEEIFVEEGDNVNQGQLLLSIETDELNYQLQELQAQLKRVKGEEERSYLEPYKSNLKQQELVIEQAEQELEEAETNMERMKELYDAEIISKKEYESAESSVIRAENYLEQQQEALSLLEISHGPGSGTSRYFSGMKQSLEAQINLVKHKISKANVTSPISGTVSDITTEEGSMVNTSSPVMTVFQKGAYEIEVFVLAEDVNSLSPDMEVELIQDNNSGDIVFPGTVEKIAPSAIERTSSLGLEEQRVKVTISPETPSAVKLRPGYKLEVDFTVDRQEGKLVVPKTALFPYEDGEAVWLVKDGKAHIQPVKKGFENESETVIVEGLETGDYIVLNPQMAGMEEGKRVTQSE